MGEPSVDFTPRAHPYIPVLDGLRGVAILLVLVAHGVVVPLDKLSTTFTDTVVRTMARGGWTGVDLFFVLSGFLITGILLDTKGQPRWWLNFISRRALRIFPLYFGTLIVLFVLLPWIVRGSETSEFLTLQSNQGWYWTYTVNLLIAFTHELGATLNTDHFWSLSIEEQFYLLWPLIVWVCKPQTLLRVAAVVMAGGVVSRLGLVLFGSANGTFMAYYLTPVRLDGLMIGAALAVLARSPGGLASLRAVAPWIFSAGAVSFTALSLINRRMEEDPIVAVIGLPVIALTFGGLLVWALTGPSASYLVRLLSGNGLRKWGRYSYCIYLVHLPVMAGVTAIMPFSPNGLALLGGSQFPRALLLAAMGMGLSYAIGWVSYHIYEEPFLKLKRYFAPRPTRVQSGAQRRLVTDREPTSTPHATSRMKSAESALR